MKKLLLLIAVVVGAGILVKRFAPDLGQIDWEKKFEAMPDNAPPKWMFNNISAIRTNTERIIELLENESASRHARDHRREHAMKVLTVFAHNDRRSFCGGVLDRFSAGLADAGHTNEVLDLYAIKFDPVFRDRDVASYTSGDDPHRHPRAHGPRTTRAAVMPGPAATVPGITSDARQVTAPRSRR